MPSESFPLIFEDGHFYLQSEGNTWLVDTGSPSSFGKPHVLSIGNREYQIHPTCPGYPGLTAESLSELAGHAIDGLIGVDILNEFDVVFDEPGKSIRFGESMDLAGTLKIPFEEFGGVPIIEVEIGGDNHRMFFDTGAQISYLTSNASITSGSSLGIFQDFFPLLGSFETPVYWFETRIGGKDLDLRFGKLPELLEMTLTIANVDGILGSEFMIRRNIGYFPSRKCLCL